MEPLISRDTQLFTTCALRQGSESLALLRILLLTHITEEFMCFWELYHLAEMEMNVIMTFPWERNIRQKKTNNCFD